MKHLCHALECNIEVPPKMLMCLKHWRMVPRAVQSAVWEHFRPGQEVDKRPSDEYLIVHRCAVLSVAIKEKVVDDKTAIAELMSILPENLARKVKVGR